jgi:predicted MFS family arabinose efflux permease
MRRAGSSLFALLAVAAGAIAANLYYAQPLLPTIAADLAVPARRVGALPMATQLGYGAGMLLLVPLGDRLERRGLIVAMTGLSSVVLVGVALARELDTLVAASFLLGFASMVPQVIVPYAATAAPQDSRGRRVGTVMSGLLVGILLSRTLSGFVGAAWGWRSVYFLAAGLMLALAALLALRLPAQRPEVPVATGEIYASLGRIFARQPILRLHSLLGAMTFGAFSVFWSTLAFQLAALPPHYGSVVVGAYGLVGVSGALAAPLVGRFADRRDPRILNGLAIVATLGSFGIFAVGASSLAALAVGVVLLDVGAQANHVSNQTRIFGLDAALRSRLNTIYMTSYFAGGALGSWVGAWAWSRAGWPGVCGAGAAMAAIALVALVREVARRAPRGRRYPAAS